MPPAERKLAVTLVVDDSTGSYELFLRACPIGSLDGDAHVFITSVTAGSANASAVVAGDELLRVAGKSVSGSKPLAVQLLAAHKAAPVKCQVLRRSPELTLPAPLPAPLAVPTPMDCDGVASPRPPIQKRTRPRREPGALGNVQRVPQHPFAPCCGCGARLRSYTTFRATFMELVELTSDPYWQSLIRHYTLAPRSGDARTVGARRAIAFRRSVDELFTASWPYAPAAAYMFACG